MLTPWICAIWRRVGVLSFDKDLLLSRNDVLTLFIWQAVLFLHNALDTFSCGVVYVPLLSRT